MRVSICEKCGSEIQEDDTNPNIHYSEPETLCWRCKAKTFSGDYAYTPEQTKNRPY